MINILKKPQYDDKTQNSLAFVLYYLTFGTSIVLSLGLIGIVLVLPINYLRFILTIFALNISSIITLTLLHKKKLEAASRVFLIFYYAIIYALSWTAGGINSPAIYYLQFVVLFTGLFFGWRKGIISGIFGIVVISLYVFLDYVGILPKSSVVHNSFTLLINFIMNLAVIVIFQILSISSLKNAIEVSNKEIENRKEIEIKLKKSNQFYNQIIESAQEGIIVYDKELRILIFNGFLENLTGIDAKKVIGKKHIDILKELNIIGLNELCLNALKGFSILNNQTEATFLKSGYKGWLSESIGPFYNDEGEIIGVIHTIRDISEQKQINIALKKLAKEYATLSDKAFFDSISRLISNEMNLDIVFVGKLNIENGEIIKVGGWSFNDVMGELRYNLENTPCQRVLNKELCYYQENVAKIFDKDIMLTKLNIESYIGAPIFDKYDTPIGILVGLSKRKLTNPQLIVNYFQFFVERISSELSRLKNESILQNEIETRKKIEEELILKYNELKELNLNLEQEKFRAEENDRLKTAFLQNLSHEIRTPLNSIIGFVNLINEEKITDNEYTEYSNLININSNRLLNTINNVLDISKIQTNQLKVKKKNFILNDFIEDIYSEKIQEYKSQDVKLIKVLSSENYYVESDEKRIKQIINNLIDNSFKFTKNGTIEFGYNIDENNIEFIVKDTGIGIPEDLQHRVFERFAQVDLEYYSGYHGGGIGLYLSKGLVELLGGNIWFTSKVDFGTSFHFTINSHIEKINLKQISNDEFEHNSKVKILIAEDDYASFLYISKMLDNSIYEILHAEDGESAIEFVKKDNSIKLIFMDIKMPKMSGYEATRIIKEFNEEIIIIAQTAYAFKVDKEMILANGCDDYLLKPIKKADLLNKLSKYIN